MSDVIYIRNIPKSVQEAIDRLFAGSPVKGAGSPVQQWHRTFVCIAALGPEIDVPALDLWHAAQRIAARRHSGEMRNEDSAKALFFQEFIALERLLSVPSPQKEILNRLSNCVYYAVYQYTQDHDIRDLLETLAYICHKANIPLVVAMRVASAKYLDRSMRELKDIASEEEAMLRVFEQFSKLPHKPLDNASI